MLANTCHTVLRQARAQTSSLSVSSQTQQSILARLLSTLAILEQREGHLQNASLGAVTAARKLGGSITGFIAGSKVKLVAEKAAKTKGLDKIVIVENDSYDKVLLWGFS